MNLSRYDQLAEEFRQFDKAHPEVWEFYLGFTFVRVENNFNHYGSKAVYERTRWDIDSINGCEGQFKMSNNHTAFYARRFHEMYPEHAGFFRTCMQTSKLEPLVFSSSSNAFFID